MPVYTRVAIFSLGLLRLRWEHVYTPENYIPLLVVSILTYGLYAAFLK